MIYDFLIYIYVSICCFCLNYIIKNIIFFLVNVDNRYDFSIL